MEATHACKVLRMRAVLVRFRLGIHTGRVHCMYCITNIVGAEATSKEDRYADQFNNAPADAPVMCHAKRPNLSVQGTITIEQEVIS